jgi:hypothetical protein
MAPGPGSPRIISITAILPPGLIASRQFWRILIQLASSRSCRTIFNG